jgi:hypothetical protein
MKTDVIKNKIEIIEKLKSENFNQEELDYILGNDEKLKKSISIFYEDHKKQKQDEQLIDGDKNVLSDRERKYLTETYNNVFDSISKEEDDFEKKIFKVTAGSIAMFFAYVILNGMHFTNVKMLYAGVFCWFFIYKHLFASDWQRMENECCGKSIFCTSRKCYVEG